MIEEMRKDGMTSSSAVKSRMPLCAWPQNLYAAHSRTHWCSASSYNSGREKMIRRRT